MIINEDVYKIVAEMVVEMVRSGDAEARPDQKAPVAPVRRG
ncbi:hypothetical protein [Geomesophilobacter sediminis]|nr:hypothetical protein [Geomesophilobacter sediminis]